MSLETTDPAPVTARDGAALDPSVPPCPALPRVSVVVVNYNYGRYLAEAVRSVRAQTYPDVECIVVDNASTDDSAAVLDAVAAVGIRVIHRASNGGQSVASLEGYAAASGDYIVFLDADDYLLPNAIATHVGAHLALRIPVGFTSGDVVQCVGARMVVATVPAFSDYVRAGTGRVADLARPLEPALAGPLAPVPADALHYVKPLALSPWVWSPTSANCFRRDALDLLLRDAPLAGMVSGTDAYLMQGVSGLTGSVLIDRPVAAYRLHGGNVFSRHPSLNGVRSFDDAGANRNNDDARRALIKHFLSASPRLGAKLHRKLDLIAVLDAVDRLWPPLRSTTPGCPSVLAEQVCRFAPRLAEIFHPLRIALWLVRLRVSPPVIVRAVRAMRAARGSV